MRGDKLSQNLYDGQGTRYERNLPSAVKLAKKDGKGPENRQLSKLSTALP